MRLAAVGDLYGHRLAGTDRAFVTMLLRTRISVSRTVSQLCKRQSTRRGAIAEPTMQLSGVENRTFARVVGAHAGEKGHMPLEV
jgi:hypothetical protein